MYKRMAKNYIEKLKDPRWQKKRLEILERDKWKCQFCFDGENTLHIHHTKYNNSDPWDIGNEFLMTVCERCHDLLSSNDLDSLFRDSCSNMLNNLKSCNGIFKGRKTVHFGEKELSLCASVIVGTISERILELKDSGRHVLNEVEKAICFIGREQDKIEDKE